MLAAQNGHPRCMTALIAAGSDFNAKSIVRCPPGLQRLPYGGPRTVDLAWKDLCGLMIFCNSCRAVASVCWKGRHDRGGILYHSFSPPASGQRFKRKTLLAVPPRLSVPFPRHAPPSRLLPASQGGDTALIVASNKGHEQCVAVLIAAGADCSASNVRCLRALQWLCPILE